MDYIIKIEDIDSYIMTKKLNKIGAKRTLLNSRQKYEYEQLKCNQSHCKTMISVINGYIKKCNTSESVEYYMSERQRYGQKLLDILFSKDSMLNEIRAEHEILFDKETNVKTNPSTIPLNI